MKAVLVILVLLSAAHARRTCCKCCCPVRVKSDNWNGQEPTNYGEWDTWVENVPPDVNPSCLPYLCRKMDCSSTDTQIVPCCHDKPAVTVPYTHSTLSIQKAPTPRQKYWMDRMVQHVETQVSEFNYMSNRTQKMLMLAIIVLSISLYVLYRLLMTPEEPNHQ